MLPLLRIRRALSSCDEDLPSVMTATTSSARFEEVALPQLEAAYSLAHWILRDRSAAEDAVQEAVLRALTYFHTFKGINARAWLLQIVRNVAYEHIRSAHFRATRGATMVAIDSSDEHTAEPMIDAQLVDSVSPEHRLIEQNSRDQIAAAVDSLPLELRECLVLREFEELSYKEIAAITAAPIGTVMSRLWRARQMLLKLIPAEAL